ncbi:hypothetical protein [Streptomyces sp. ODS28]|uniref:hypothetical protein n=1 Tax=Streptomyces sp. ODS28 TaxID=3136688 RepID=UPI0031EAE208
MTPPPMSPSPHDEQPHGEPSRSEPPQDEPHRQGPADTTAPNDTVPLGEDVRALLDGFPDVGDDEQGFPFFTVDDQGYPHAALLSRAELQPGPGTGTLFAVLAGTRTRANLARDGRAALLAVHGAYCHRVKLRLVESRDHGDLLGCVFAVTERAPDSVGITLQPLGFRTTGELAHAEQWKRSAAILAELAAAYDGPA